MGHWTTTGVEPRDCDDDDDVSQSALKKLQNRTCMWYHGSEMAPLLPFFSKVSDEEKKSNVEAMILSADNCCVRGIKCPLAECNELEKKQVHELVTSSRAASRWL